jgi:hypothetical protein
MPDTPRTARDSALLHVETLIRRGHELELSAAHGGATRVDEVRAWQLQCAAAITHLSGGSKVHWLSRAFSEAFLVRSIDGAAVVEAPGEDILRRIVSVLVRARVSLQQMDEAVDAGLQLSGDETSPHVQRFSFVHASELRPVLERAYADSHDSFDRGDYGQAFVLTCSVLEAIITDALEHAHASAPRTSDASAAAHSVSQLPFDARIAAAEQAGLIRGGCARLPPAALAYRDLLDDDGAIRGDAIVIARDARRAGQVLRIVIRDLDPGR